MCVLAKANLYIYKLNINVKIRFSLVTNVLQPQHTIYGFSYWCVWEKQIGFSLRHTARSENRKEVNFPSVMGCYYSSMMFAADWQLTIARIRGNVCGITQILKRNYESHFGFHRIRVWFWWTKIIIAEDVYFLKQN